MIRALPGLVVLIVGAPLVPGIIVRTKSILTGRRGAPVWQLYADLWKLARRGTVYSRTTTAVFRLAPVVVVASALAASLLVPLDGHASLIRFGGDAVAFVYLLALGRFSIVLAAMDTGSSFEGMGASREVTFASVVEPGIFIALAALGVMAGDFTLTGMLGASASPVSSVGVAKVAPAVMISVSLFALALAECSRVPVDDPATHLELTMVHEVMVLDHSGPDLAMILYANALKLSLFAAIILNVLVSASGSTLASPVTLVGSFFVVGIAIGVVESVIARLRLPRVPLYAASGSALALFALILLLR